MQGRRLMITGYRQIEVQPFELATDGLGPAEVVIRTRVSLLSGGTEGAWFQGLGLPSGQPAPYPRTTGYATVGEVIAVGGPAARVAVGDLVYSMSQHASLARVDAARTLCLTVPDGLPVETAVFARLVTVPLATLRTSGARAGDRAAVVGLGLVGNLGAQVLEAAGLPTTGVDLVPARRALAERCGVTATIDPRAAGAVEAVHRLVLEASGTARGAATAIGLARTGGEVSLVGTPWLPDPEVSSREILEPVHVRFITIRSGWEWQLPMFDTSGERNTIHQPGSVEHSTRFAFDLLRRGRVRVDELITHRYRPAECQAAYDGALDRRHEQLGVVFNWEE